MILLRRPQTTILLGDSLAVLRTLPSDSVDCVVTSPPYWGLRDYGTGMWEGGDRACDHELVNSLRLPWANGVPGPNGRSKNLEKTHWKPKTRDGECGRCGAQRSDQQMGLEATLGEHVEAMVVLFREVRRVLKPTGTLWLNYGDSYATSMNGRSAADTKAAGNDDRTFRDKPFSTVGPIYDPTPSGAGGAFEDERPGFSAERGRIRVAKRVTTETDRRDEVKVGGWGASDRSLRWRGGGTLKPKDLCGVPWRVALALQDDGWWLRQDIIWAKSNPMPESIRDRCTKAHEYMFLMTKNERYYFDAEAIKEDVTGGAHRRAPADKIKVPGGWDVGKGAHGTINRAGRTEATYVEKVGGVTPKSAEAGSGIKANASFHAATTDLVEKRNKRSVWTIATYPFPGAHYATFPPALVEPCVLAGCPPNGIVLDPFLGSGTVGMVANRLGRDCVGIELNPESVEIARNRIDEDTI